MCLLIYILERSLTLKVTAAVTKEQGVVFVAVMVKSHVVSSTTEAQNMIASCQQWFGVNIVVLVGEDKRTRSNNASVQSFVGNNYVRLPWKDSLPYRKRVEVRRRKKAIAHVKLVLQI